MNIVLFWVEIKNLFRALADPLIRLKWIDVILIYLVFIPIDTQMIFLPDSKWSRMVRNYVRQKYGFMSFKLILLDLKLNNCILEKRYKG